MSGLSSIKGYPGCFIIAYLTDEDNIRVKPQERAKQSCKCQIDLGFYLGLHDSGKAVFNGIFGGYDFDAGVIDILEGSVKGGGLSAARGARHQYHPGRTFKKSLQRV